MCGRFSLLADLSTIVNTFAIERVATTYQGDSNFSPGRDIYAVIHEGGNTLVSLRWGLIPAWAKDPAIGKNLFNARAETVTTKPSFRRAFFNRRCLIPAQGFYEWPKKGEKRGPLFFSLKSRLLFGLAGLYETWVSPEGKSVTTCTIITTAANTLIEPYHERMPVIIPAGEEGKWLHKGETTEVLLTLLRPYPAEDMVLESR